MKNVRNEIEVVQDSLYRDNKLIIRAICWIEGFAEKEISKKLENV